MLVPVLFLMLWRAILDQLAFTASLTSHPPINAQAIHTAVRTLATPSQMGGFLVEADIAVDPIAHLPCFDPSAVPPPSLDG